MLLGGDACDGRGFYASNAASSYMCIDTGGVGHNTAAEGFSFHNENSDKGNEEDGQQPEQWEQQWLPLPLTGKDSPPSSPGRARERRFPAVGTNKYMAPEVEFDSRFGVQVCVLLVAAQAPHFQSFFPPNTPPNTQNKPIHVQHTQADIFSLGVVLHVLLTGKFPRTGLNQPAAIDDGVPDVDGPSRVCRPCYQVVLALARHSHPRTPELMNYGPSLYV